MTRWFWIVVAAWLVGGIAMIHIAAQLGVLNHLPIWLCAAVGILLGLGGLIFAFWADLRAVARHERARPPQIGCDCQSAD